MEGAHEILPLCRMDVAHGASRSFTHMIEYTLILENLYVCARYETEKRVLMSLHNRDTAEHAEVVLTSKQAAAVLALSVTESINEIETDLFDILLDSPIASLSDGLRPIP